MIHLVTGYAGSEHIQSADQGSFNAAFFGTGQFVMDIGNKFSASITSNNNVRVLDGDLLMHGRHIRINPDTYEDLTIQNGTAGKKRIDLIVMTYEKNTSTGVETAYLEVIKGTESTGTATEPSYTSGNILNGATKNQMPLYAVSIEGVVLASVNQKFAICPTYKALAEQYESEFVKSCTNYLNSLNILDSGSGITDNTESKQLAGALGVKELYNNLITAISGKAASIHNHDDRYYTEAEVRSLLNSIFYFKDFTASVQSVPSQSFKVFTIDVSVGGYTPIGLYKLNANTLLQANYIIDGNTVKLTVSNITSAALNCAPLIGVLYRKNF